MREQNLFMIVWDMTGLESVVNVDDIAEADTMNALKGEKGSELGRTLHYFTLRARANNHRHYEIYTIRTTVDLTKEDLEQWFERDPQAAADMIRERGNKIYSDRVNTRTQVIA